ncbi:MAG: hypothetical protein ABJB66_10365 [Gemmatimonadaceae bacterium]
MFHVEFINHESEEDEDGFRFLPGRITLDDHVEDFLASIHAWPREEYEHQ